MYLFSINGRDFKVTQMRCFETFEEAYQHAVESCKKTRDAFSTNGTIRPCDYGCVVYDSCIWEVFPDKAPVRVRNLMDKLMKELWPELHTSADGENE